MKTEIKRIGNPNWKKGKSATPSKVFKKGNKVAVGHGRPPKLPSLDEAMAKILSEEKNGKTGLEQILDRMKASAKQGNVKAAALVLDRGYGKAQQSIDITTKGDKFESVHPEIKVYNTAPPLTESEIAVITPDKVVKQLKK